MTPFEIADALRACLVTAFEDDDGIPAEICHRPGQEAPLSLGMAQDECCSGLAWVRIAGIAPVVDPDESQAPDFDQCHANGRQITFELGVARCNPYGDASRGPSCEAWTELALRMDLDAAAMRAAVCCFTAANDVGPEQEIYSVRPGAWEPLESSGGCAGGIMTVVVFIDCGSC